jgi:hypothetical protein
MAGRECSQSFRLWSRAWRRTAIGHKTEVTTERVALGDSSARTAGKWKMEDGK